MPLPKKDLLDEVPIQYKDVKADPSYQSKNIAEINRLFPDNYFCQTERKNNKDYLDVNKSVGLNGKKHFKVLNSFAFKDHITDILRNSIKDKRIKKDITSKPNLNDFKTFSDSAKNIYQEKISEIEAY